MFFFRAASGCMRRPAGVVDSDCQLVYLNAVSPISRKSLRMCIIAHLHCSLLGPICKKKVCACGRRAQEEDPHVHV